MASRQMGRQGSRISLERGTPSWPAPDESVPFPLAPSAVMIAPDTPLLRGLGSPPASLRDRIMNLSSRVSVCLHGLLGVVVVLMGTGPSQGQKKRPGISPNPQAPTLKPAVPLGMQRGTTLDLALTGTNLAEPTSLWTSFPAKVAIPTEGNNGKDNGKLLVRLEVPKHAPIGFHTIRLATRRGMSNLRLFCIDDLPQVLEGNTNHTP